MRRGFGKNLALGMGAWASRDFGRSWKYGAVVLAVVLSGLGLVSGGGMVSAVSGSFENDEVEVVGVENERRGVEVAAVRGENGGGRIEVAVAEETGGMAGEQIAARKAKGKLEGKATEAEKAAAEGESDSSGGSEDKKCDGVETSIIGSDGCLQTDDKGSGIYTLLNLVLTILTYGVGILGTLGLVISGIQYATAGDNEQQAVKAKTRIREVVIGLIIYAVLWAALQWLLPGGIFGTA